MRCRRLVFLAFIAAATPLPGHAQAARAAYQQAWREHQAQVDSVVVRWYVKAARRKEWMANPFHQEPGRERDRTILRERTDSIVRLLAISGNRMRHRVIDRHVPAGSNLSVPDTVTSDWSEHHPSAQDLPHRPLLLAFRPLDRTMGQPRLDRMRVARTEVFRNRPLLVLEGPVDSAGWRSTLWLETARDYIVRRLVLFQNQAPMVEQMIDYFQHPRYGYLPCRWVTLRMKVGGALWQSDEARVTSLSINGENVELPAENAPRTRACR